MAEEDFKIELEDIGEGLSGDYDEADPEDVPLLRFYCYVKGQLRRKLLSERPWDLEDRSDANMEEWVSVNCGSFCTRLPATLAQGDVASATAYLFERVYPAVVDGTDMKRTLERMSWIDESWLRNQR